MTVGIIGVGAMGLAITERLVAAGIAVSGFRRGDLAAFRAAGGQPMTDVAAVAKGSDPLILLLPNDDALLEVAAAAAPVLSTNQVVMCLSTHPVAVKRAAADIAHSHGAVLLDGEISGTPDMLRAGQATVMIAGTPEQVSRVRPVLDAFAQDVTMLKSFGEATTLKLITNVLVGIHTAAAAEALEAARRLGLDVAIAIAAIVPSAGGSRMLAIRGPMMARDSYGAGNIAGFLGGFNLLREALAERQQGVGPIFDVTEKLYRRAIDEGFGGLDIAAVHQSLARAFDRAATEPVPPPTSRLA